MAPSGLTAPAAGVMATRPATAPEAAPSVVAWPSRRRSVPIQATQRRGGGDLGVHEGQRGQAVRGERRAGVEAEPAEPQQAGAEHDEGQVVRAHRLAAEALALAEHEHEGERGGAGVDVHGGAAGEVERAEAVDDPAAAVLGEQARGGAGALAVLLGDAEGEDPVGDREVDERRPQDGEGDPGAELHAVGDGAADERDGDDGEHDLEAREGQVGQAEGVHDTALGLVEGDAVDDVAEADEPAAPAEQPASALAEGDGVAGYRARPSASRASGRR